MKPTKIRSMKPMAFTVAASSLMLTAPSALNAQESTSAPTPAPPPPANPSTGFINDYLRQQSGQFDPWDIGGQFRVRFEHRENTAVPGASDFSADAKDNSYWLLREKVHIGYTPVSWFSVFAEMRDSSSHEDERNPNPEADTADLHQAFVRLGGSEEVPIEAKVGRQELSYGDERLVGAFDWNNVGRVFDAAKLRLVQEGCWIELFSGRVNLIDDNNFNTPNDYDWFSGIYASTLRLCPKQVSELYFFSRNTGEQSPRANEGGQPQAGGPGPRDVLTLGTRMKSLPGTLHGWDYSVEAAGQFGTFNLDGRRQDHKAFAVHAGGGYTFVDLPWNPRVAAEYNFASGDRDPSDEDHTTFENLFPTNHKFYGYMDFLSWQNLHNPRLTFAAALSEKLKVTLDLHAFWLAETEDFFYQANGTPRTSGGYGRNPDASSFVGGEIDLVATYNLLPTTALQAGYGHFFAEDYIQDSLPDTSDADWIYAQMTFAF